MRSGTSHPGEWPRILQHTTTAGLTTLKIGITAPRNILNNVVPLTQLHTLHFRAMVAVSPLRSEPLETAVLPALPALTAIRVSELRVNMHRSTADAIAACTQLREIRLDSPHFGAGGFRRLFASSHVARLQRLELAGFQAEQSDGYAEAFAAMTGLRHIELSRVWSIDFLLAGLSLAPHLAVASITASCQFGVDPPSVDALQTLFAQTATTSRVHVHLCLCGRPHRRLLCSRSASTHSAASVVRGRDGRPREERPDGPVATRATRCEEPHASRKKRR